MSENINLQKDEIELLVSKMQLMHQIAIKNIPEVKEKIKVLANSVDTFQVKKISQKIEGMLYMLSVPLLAQLEQEFAESNKIVAQMIESTVTVDTVSEKGGK